MQGSHSAACRRKRPVLTARRGLAVGGVACLCLSSCSSLQPKTTTWSEVLKRVPSTRQDVVVALVEIPSGAPDSPFMGVRVREGEDEHLFQIDTGSSVSVLRDSLRGRMKLHRMGTAEMEGFAVTSTEHSLHWTSSLALGDSVLKSEPVTFLADAKFDSMPKSVPTRVDGILGASLLQRGEIEFDVTNRRLIIRPFEESTLGGNRERIPFVHDEKLNGYAISLEKNGRSSARCIFDTGSNAALIFDKTRYIGESISSTDPIGQSECSTFRGTYTVKAYRLPFPLELGRYRFQPGLTVYVEQRKDQRLDGSVGIPVIWGCKRVILNARLEQALFDPRESADGGGSHPVVGGPSIGGAPSGRQAG